MLQIVDTYERDLLAARPLLYRYAMSLCRSDSVRADDMVQDTLVSALTYKHLFKPGTNLDAWLVTILRNKFRSTLRKRKEVEDPDDAMAIAMSTRGTQLQRLEIIEVLKVANKLPDAFKQTILRLADGATYDEIAFELHEHVGTIKSRAHRAREILRKL